MNLKETPAVVTGGASGLGAAAAEMLVRNGAKVAIFDVNDKSGLEFASSINASYFRTDVTSDEGVVASLEEAEKNNGPARILVNCAGIGTPSKTVGREGEPHDLAVYRKVIEVNLVGTFNVASKFAARLSALEIDEEERGVIINTASVAAFDGQIGQAAYSSSKGGVVGMTLPMARDLSSLSIRVMTIAPGIFLTPMLEGLPEPAKQSLGMQVPFPSRLGKPEEYAQMVEAVIGNPMLNGETIRLDGAIRMAPK